MANKRRIVCAPLGIATVDSRIAKEPLKVAAAYYQTQEHRAWSRQVIGAAHGCCQECGHQGVRLYADHIVEVKDIELGLAPRSLLTDSANGRALCGACHGRKTARERRGRLGGADA